MDKHILSTLWINIIRYLTILYTIWLNVWPLSTKMKEDERCTIGTHKRVHPFYVWSILLIITLVSIILSLEALFVEGFTFHSYSTSTTTQTTVLSHPIPTKLFSNTFQLNANNNNNNDDNYETEVRPSSSSIPYSVFLSHIQFSFHDIYSPQQLEYNNSFFFFSNFTLWNILKKK